MRLLFALLVFLASPQYSACFAQPYVGVVVLRSTQHPNTLGRVGDIYIVEERYTTANLLAGYTLGAWSVEVGGGPLGQRTSENISDTFDIKQEITTRYFYAAALRSFRVGTVNLYGRLGLAEVKMENHEFGFNENGPNQEQRNSSSTTQPMFGAGVSYAIRRLAIRAELFRINNVARSEHTNSSDVTAFALGLQYMFGKPP